MNDEDDSEWYNDENRVLNIIDLPLGCAYLAIQDLCKFNHQVIPV